MIVTMFLFLFFYICILCFPKYKSYIALLAAIVFISSGNITFIDAIKSIDYNVLLMLIGTMGLVSLFIDSKMPALLADNIINKMPNSRWMIIALCLFSALISAFVDNVATVLMLVPITFTIAKKLKISPIPLVISVSIFSNLEGAATLVGDTTSILLADSINMDFLDFFFYDGKIGLFFIVQLSVIAATLVLYFVMRNRCEELDIKRFTKVKDYLPTILLLLCILTLILVSFIPNKLDITNGLICIIYFIIGLIFETFKNKDIGVIINNIKNIDYKTLIFLSSLFIIVASIKNVGGLDLIANIFLKFSNNEFVSYTAIVIISVIITMFIDNIPYVTIMLPVIATISSTTGINPTLLYYGLIVGATLGGNFTPVGATANIASIGMLEKEGYHVSLKDYLKYSVPLTLTACATGYILILVLCL